MLAQLQSFNHKYGDKGMLRKSKKNWQDLNYVFLCVHQNKQCSYFKSHFTRGIIKCSFLEAYKNTCNEQIPHPWVPSCKSVQSLH